MIAHLTVHQVYDAVNQTMIPFRQAIDLGYLDLEFFSYASANFTMSIHDAFSRGFILGELRTSSTSTPAAFVDDRRACEYDSIFSSMTNIIRSLSEFRNTIQISDTCELTDDGFIKETTTDKRHLLTQAIELGLISIAELTTKFQCHTTQNASALTLMNESHASDMDISYADETISPELHPGVRRSFSSSLDFHRFVAALFGHVHSRPVQIHRRLPARRNAFDQVESVSSSDEHLLKVCLTVLIIPTIDDLS